MVDPTRLFDEARRSTRAVEQFAQSLPPGPLRREFTEISADLRRLEYKVTQPTSELGVPPLAILGAGAAGALLPWVGAWTQRKWDDLKDFVFGTKEAESRWACVERARKENESLSEEGILALCNPRPAIPTWAWGVVGGLLLFGVLAFVTARRRFG